jgi:hypothetical protein
VIGWGAFNMERSHLTFMRDAGIMPVAACDIDASRNGSGEGRFSWH